MAESTTPTTEPELRDLLIDGTEHYALTTAGETLCGLLISATQAGGTFLNTCQHCLERSGCDECGHGVGLAGTHLWAPGAEAAGSEAAAEFIYSNATCWAEHICRECSPELYAEAVAMLELGTCPTCGRDLLAGGNPDCATCAAEPNLLH